MRRSLMFGVLALAACSSNSSNTDARQADSETDQAGDVTGRDAGRDVRRDTSKPDLRSPDTAPATPWTQVKTGFSGTIYGMWGLSATSIYVVGKEGLIAHYDGNSWSQMSNPETTDLYAIWGTSDKQLFAVGDNAILAYDGTSWEMDPDYYSYSGDSFRGVWGPSATDVYVVGTSGGEASIQHKDASSYYWDEVLSSPPAKGLAAIWGQGSDIIVVGQGGTIYKKSGSGFATMSSTVTSDLNAIWGPSAQDLFAVGFDGTIIHYDGTSWSVMNTGSFSYFYGVWGASNKDIYTVGQGIFQPDETVFHYDGTAWSKMLAPRVRFGGVWGSSATDIYAFSVTDIYHYGGTP